MEHQLDMQKFRTLLERMKTDKDFAESLGVLKDNPSKRSAEMSPLRLNKVSKKSLLAKEDGISEPDDSARIEDEDSDRDSDKSEDPLEALEKEVNVSDESADEDEGASSKKFNLLGDTDTPNWSPSKEALEFYMQAVDVQLKSEINKALVDKYKSSDKIDEHFSAPHLPEALWNAVQGDFHDSNRLKAIFKIQNNLFLAIKPLLSLLDTVEKEQADVLLESIELICSSNLDLNKFRRVMVARHLQPQLRKQVLNLPVTHNTCFGDDFSKATDNIIKEQAAIDKIIKKPAYQRLSFNTKKFTNFKQPFRGRGGAGSSRGSSRGYNSRGERGRGSRRGYTRGAANSSYSQ